MFFYKSKLLIYIFIALSAFSILSSVNAEVLNIGRLNNRIINIDQNINLLPIFKYDRYDIELNQKSVIEIILNSNSKVVDVEVIDATSSDLSVDQATAIDKGLKIFGFPKAQKNTNLPKNKVKAKNRIVFNLKEKTNQQNVDKDDDFKTFKISVAGVIPGTYTIRAIVDGGNTSTTKIIAKPEFRIDSISPPIVDIGKDVTFVVKGKGLDSLTQVDFGNGFAVNQLETLDDTTVKADVSVDLTVTRGFHSVTVKNLLTGSTASLIDSIYVGPQIGIDGMDGVDGQQGPQGLPGQDGMSLCVNSADQLMILTNNLPPGSTAKAEFDPEQCNLVLGIPVGFNGNNGESGSDGMSVCTNMNSNLAISSVTLAEGSMATSQFDPNACTIVLGIPKGTTGSTGATGASGLNGLVSLTTESAGANCAAGGKKVQSGLDSNNNNVLDAGEVTATNYVCNGVAGTNGANGSNGTNGSNSLVLISNEGAGVNCGTGGKKVETGVDSDNSGVLDAGEVSATNYVCNGVAGANGTNGTNGINCWDLNGNGSNDSNEDINMDGSYNTLDCLGPEIKTPEELAANWSSLSDEQNFTTVSGDMTRMVKIPYFINDGIIYGGFWIDKYEASKSDASASSAGSSSIPVSQRNVVPWTGINQSTAKTNASASGRQISGLGTCKLIGMREWTAVWLLGRYSKSNSLYGATASNGWNERGNTRSGQDGRASSSYTCTDDPTESGASAGRCLTGTGLKSWGHVLDGSATKNIDGTTFSMSGTADTVNNSSSSFDDDKQVYDLAGNVREWIDFALTRSGGTTTVDAGYPAAGQAIPQDSNVNFTYNDLALGSQSSADSEFQGLGFPTMSGSITDLNGANNGGRFTRSGTNASYGTVRGGSLTDSTNANSPVSLDISNSPTTSDTATGFRVICDFSN